MTSFQKNPATLFKYHVFSDIVPSIVHELKNPLSAITLGLEFFGLNLPENDPRKSAINNSSIAAEHINILLDAMLMYCQNSGQPRQLIDLRDLTGKAVSLVNYYVTRKGVSVAVANGGSLPMIGGYGNHVLQALVYLIVFFADSTPKGGRIDLAFEHRDDEVILFAGGPVDGDVKREENAQLISEAARLLADDGGSLVAVNRDGGITYELRLPVANAVSLYAGGPHHE
jgi:signal transduction histidine kinase